MIHIDTTHSSAPLRRPWKNGIAVGRAYDLTRADVLDHLRWLQQEIGFRTCRFHAVFHDDMGIVQRRRDGTLVYQWHHLDKVYDSLLALGLKPFVEFNPMPAALASGPDTMFYYKTNITPPREWSEWFVLVRAFTAHCVERYGLPEVRQWHFEVWNEPDLSGFWSGTKEEYFQLYAHAARAARASHWSDTLRFQLPVGARGDWLATTSHVRAGAGSAFETWEAIGAPVNLSASQLAMLRLHAEPAASAALVTAADCGIELPVTLAANEFLHLELRPCEISDGHKNDQLSLEQVAKIEAQLGAQSLALLTPGIADTDVTPAMLNEAISHILEADLIHTRKQAKDSKAIKVSPGIIARNFTALAQMVPGVAQKFQAFNNAVRGLFGLATTRSLVTKTKDSFISDQSVAVRSLPASCGPSRWGPSNGFRR